MNKEKIEFNPKFLGKYEEKMLWNIQVLLEEILDKLCTNSPIRNNEIDFSDSNDSITKTIPITVNKSKTVKKK